MHKKIMHKCADKLSKDAKRYASEEKEAKKKNNPTKARQEHIEKKEALAAAKDMRKRAKKAHEYS